MGRSNWKTKLVVGVAFILSIIAGVLERIGRIWNICNCVTCISIYFYKGITYRRD